MAYGGRIMRRALQRYKEDQEQRRKNIEDRREAL